ncbi:MAG: hypothetical protein ACYSUT_09850 [Planctomycetota bacterium]
MNSYIADKRSTIADYQWLRWPSVLMGSVGVWGIGNAKLEVVAAYSGVFNLPPLAYCYAITGFAAVLFCIAIFYRQTRHTEASGKTGRRQWRGH